MMVGVVGVLTAVVSIKSGGSSTKILLVSLESIKGKRRETVRVSSSRLRDCRRWS